MDLYYETRLRGRASFSRRFEWRFTDKSLLILLYINIFILQTNSQTIIKEEPSQKSITKSDFSNVDLNIVNPNHCHNCQSSSKFSNLVDDHKTQKRNQTDDEDNSFLEDVLDTFEVFTEQYYLASNKSETQLQREVETFLDTAMSKDRYEIVEGVEIKTIANNIDSRNDNSNDESRALFSKFTFEYRLLQKIKNFVDTHILSISLPKAARLMGFRCK